MTNILYSIILGMVQGVAEWLPISSKTQVLVVSHYLFSISIPVAFALGLFMEVGSLGSASFYFRKEILSLLRDRKLLAYLFVVTVVTGVVGVPLFLVAERLLQGSYNVGIPMIVLGAFLIFDAAYIRYSRRSPKIGGLKDMSLKHYVAIGLAQGIAALPGVSRSGMTTSTMLFMGVEPKDAFRLSYLAYIPASIGAFGATLVFSREEVTTAITAIDSTGIAIAIVTSGLVGLVAISLLLKFAKNNNIYVVTLVLGVLALAVGVLGTLE